MTYSTDVLIPANSSARTERLGAFDDDRSGRFLTTATLPYTFFWNEHTLCVGFLIQCIHWELYEGICHHSSVVLQKKNHDTDILCIKLQNVIEVRDSCLNFTFHTTVCVCVYEVVYAKDALNFSAVFQFVTVHQNTCLTHFITDNQNYHISRPIRCTGPLDAP
jgi:hypothetical protein